MLLKIVVFLLWFAFGALLMLPHMRRAVKSRHWSILGLILFWLVIMITIRIIWTIVFAEVFNTSFWKAFDIIHNNDGLQMIIGFFAGLAGRALIIDLKKCKKSAV